MQQKNLHTITVIPEDKGLSATSWKYPSADDQQVDHLL